MHVFTEHIYLLQLHCCVVQEKISRNTYLLFTFLLGVCMYNRMMHVRERERAGALRHRCPAAAAVAGAGGLRWL